MKSEVMLANVVGALVLGGIIFGQCSKPEKEMFPHNDSMHTPTEENLPAPESLPKIPNQE